MQQIGCHRALALEVAVDVVVPLEAVLPQQTEGDRQLAPVHDAPGLVLRLQRRDDGLVDEDAKLPGWEKSSRVVNRVALRTRCFWRRAASQPMASDNAVPPMQ